MKGEGSFDYALVINNLASVYLGLNKYSKVIKLYKSCTKIFSRTEGKDCFNVVAFYNLALCYHHQAKRSQASYYRAQSKRL